ncbi:ABC transporter permease [Lysinibacillus sp. G4S2]|uniref:ABC transporter permease n=1 Tax=Lysinibacillus sp. G4S2 TaxID=3055859 RepID=UPI0025A24EBA|nr:ABC transporter permease [Lysinibacillus sp. G4S2]MDM5247611.1 ABC transporter permease [Lysinibacillus sp. G4S2]
MNEFLIMFCSNYKTMFKTKSFLTVTIMIALAIVVVFNIDRIYQLIGKGEQHTSILVTANNQEIATTLQDFYSINKVEGMELQFVDSLEEAKKMLEKKDEYEYILNVEENEELNIQATIITETEKHIETNTSIQMFLTIYQSYLYMQKIPLSVEDSRAMIGPIDISTDSLIKELKTASYNTTNMFFVYAFVFILYFSLGLYASQLANAVASEKSTRVMELVISSISATNYLYAKIFATLAVSFTQIGIWLLVFTVSLQVGSYEQLTIFQDISLDSLNIPLVFLGIIFYVLGFVLYGSLACLIGSLMTKAEEASQAIFPIVALLLAALLIGVDGIMSPNSTLVQVTSYIPFFTPIVMFVRLAFVEVNYVAIILSILGLLMTTIFAVIGAAYVFRGGILLYTKGSFKNLKKALKM